MEKNRVQDNTKKRREIKERASCLSRRKKGSRTKEVTKRFVREKDTIFFFPVKRFLEWSNNPNDNCHASDCTFFFFGCFLFIILIFGFDS